MDKPIEAKKPSLLDVSFGDNKEQETFLENFALLIGAGMGIGESLTTLSQETKSKAFKYKIDSMLNLIDAGWPIWKAFAETKLLKDYYLSLLKVGEESGKLAENLLLIVSQEEKRKNFNSKVKSAMLYPAIVFGLTIVVAVSVSWFVLPRIAKVFSDLHIPLPPITKVVIFVGTFLQNYGVYVIPGGLVLMFVIFYLLFVNRSTKYIGQNLGMIIPGISTIIKQVEISRFGFIMGSLLESGMPVGACIETLQSASEIGQYRTFYKHLQASIVAGNSFSTSFGQYKGSNKLFPLHIQQMVFSGEQSGKLSTTLKKIGTLYEARIDNAAKNLATALEPILLVGVWIGVVLVALAVILPIYGLIGDLASPPQEKLTSTNTHPEITLEGEPPESPSASVSATPGQFATASGTLKPTITIRTTETGILNVRESATTISKIVTTVSPGATYPLLQEETGWTQIELLDGTAGWILSRYAEKTSE